MAKKLTKEDLFNLNIIGTKKVCENRKYDTGHYNDGSVIQKVKIIFRTKFLKICWNCGCAYESWRHNSYACSNRCSWNLNYKIKNGIPPPANMALKTKLKNVKNLLEEFGY